MAVIDQTPYTQAVGNNVTTVFPFNFLVLAKGDLKVYLDTVLKVLDVDYTVDGTGVLTGGNVTFAVAPANGVDVSILRDMARTRSTDYQNLGDFNADVVDADFDRAILLAQDNRTALGRVLRVAESEFPTIPELPSVVNRASKFLGFDAQGQPEVLADVGPTVLSRSVIGGFFYPQTIAEVAAAVTPTDFAFPEMDPRRYGAVNDYNIATETDGQVATNATDNLAAIQTAVAVAEAAGGGVIAIMGGGIYYVSNSIDARGISNLSFYVEPGTELWATKYTNLGTLILLGGDTVAGLGTLVENVGVYGGGTLRTHQPDHATVDPFDTVSDQNHAVGDYVLSTDTNGEPRAYYCKTAGLSNHLDPPDAVSGSSTSGTAVFQDADNDNVISLHGFGLRVDGMNIPEASGKPITVQVPLWGDVWITRNKIGTTNDKGIEVKGNQAIAGQEAAFGDGIHIEENTIEWTGHEGIDVEQPSFSSALNQNAWVCRNLVRSAGNIIAAAGVHINRCNRVEVRGNKVLESGGNGYHIRLCGQVTGDIHSENAGVHGVHMQQCSDFALDSVYVKDATSHGFAESSDVLGGYIGRLVVDGAVNGYNESSRAGAAPVVATYRMTNISGAEFSGLLPTLLANVPAAKFQSFVLTLVNTAGTLQHQIIAETVNAGASAFADRITAAQAALGNTPTAADGSTAFAFGGKVSSANTNEFILNHANPALDAHAVGQAVIIHDDTDLPKHVALVRRSVDVNGATLSRWHLAFRLQTDGAATALNTTNLEAGERISVRVQMFLP